MSKKKILVLLLILFIVMIISCIPLLIKRCTADNVIILDYNDGSGKQIEYKYNNDSFDGFPLIVEGRKKVINWYYDKELKNKFDNKFKDKLVLYADWEAIVFNKISSFTNVVYDEFSSIDETTKLMNTNLLVENTCKVIELKGNGKDYLEISLEIKERKDDLTIIFDNFLMKSNNEYSIFDTLGNKKINIYLSGINIIDNLYKGGCAIKCNDLNIYGEGSLDIMVSGGNKGSDGLPVKAGNHGNNGNDGNSGGTGISCINLYVNDVTLNVMGGNGGDGGNGSNGENSFSLTNRKGGHGGNGGHGGSAVAVENLYLNNCTVLFIGGNGGYGGDGAKGGGSYSLVAGRGGNGGNGGDGAPGLHCKKITVNNSQEFYIGGNCGRGGSGASMDVVLDYNGNDGIDGYPAADKIIID